MGSEVLVIGTLLTIWKYMGYWIPIFLLKCLQIVRRSYIMPLIFLAQGLHILQSMGDTNMWLSWHAFEGALALGLFGYGPGKLAWPRHHPQGQEENFLRPGSDAGGYAA
jgi:hypothetical protein